MASTAAEGGVDRETQSFAAMYDSFGALAFTLAHRIVRDPGIAEDVVQESFLAIWRNAGRYDAGRGSMQAWLCRVVRNRAIDRLRDVSGRQRHDRSLDAYMSLVSAHDVVSDVLRLEETRAVKSAMASLPPMQREVIDLAYYGGKTQSEIAVLTGVPLGTVKGRTRSAMRSLAAALGALRDPALAEAPGVSGSHRRLLAPRPADLACSQRRVTRHSLQSDANAGGADH
ncbi:MAG: sigma-70 family RNA polymerase sigma factor [Candidatus Dormibacteraeota bacterium]|nr:sigma-70 family RNA polymerase sigma factor [Candidatus Dormibacteraeota bacterium]